MNARDIKKRLRDLWNADQAVREAFRGNKREFASLRDRLIQHWHANATEASEKMFLTRKERDKVSKAYSIVEEYARKMLSPDFEQSLANSLPKSSKNLMQKRIKDTRRFLADLKRYRKRIIVDGKRNKRETIYPAFQGLRRSIQMRLAILSSGPKDETTAAVLSAFYDSTITRKYVELRRRNDPDILANEIMRRLNGVKLET